MCGCVFAFNAFKVYNYIYNAFVLRKKQVRLNSESVKWPFSCANDVTQSSRALASKCRSVESR